MRQLTRSEAVAIANAGEWKLWSDEDIVKLQLYQNRLCMDFSRFHEALEKVLGRPIWTHEFADSNRLIAEYEGKRKPPTMQEIIEMLPADKTILVGVTGEENP